ncbi:MAG: CBS domain-containing protein [Planctomycetaceae bacterium]
MKALKAKAQDIMTADLLTVTPSTTLTQFARILTEDNISGCPVVTIGGRLVGIASKTDLIARLLEGRHDYGSSPVFRGLLGFGEEGLVASPGTAEQSEEEIYGTVEDIMETVPVTVLPDATVLDVARSLAEHRIHRVLVQDKGKLKGIITSLDVIAHFASAGE